MTPQERLQAALDSLELCVLCAVVVELADEGCPKGDLGELLEKLLLDLRRREHHREADEDGVLDILDALAGWCHSDARLLAEAK